MSDKSPSWQLWGRRTKWKFRMWRRARPPCPGNGAALPSLTGVPKASSDWSPDTSTALTGASKTQTCHPRWFRVHFTSCQKSSLISCSFQKRSKAMAGHSGERLCCRKRQWFSTEPLEPQSEMGQKCCTAGILILLFLSTHIYKPLENTQ